MKPSTQGVDNISEASYLNYDGQSAQEHNLIKKIGLNSTWLLITRVVTQLQLILFVALVARRLGEAGFGQYAFITSLVLFGNIFTTFGTDTYLIREIAKNHTNGDRNLSASLWLQLSLSILFCLAIFLGASYLPNKNNETIAGLKIYSLALFPLAFYSVYSAVLRAYQRMDLYLVTNLVTVFLQTAAAWLVLQNKTGLIPLILILLAVQIFTAVLAGVLCHAIIPGFSLQLRTSTGVIESIIKAVWPLALLSGLGILYQRIGIFALSLSSNDAQTGLFSAASRIVEALKFGHIAVLGALLPALSELNGVELKRQGALTTAINAGANLFRRSFYVLLALAFVIAAGTTLLAHTATSLIYGSNYIAAVPAMQLLAWTLIPYTVTASFSTRLITLGKERTVLLVICAGLLTALLMNLWLIPILGTIGASLATIAAESLQAGLFLFFRSK
jgi:O-antigen/teichoic acid export membrane protein